MYTDTSRVSEEAKAELAREGGALREYNRLPDDLRVILYGDSRHPPSCRSGASGVVAAVDELLAAPEAEAEHLRDHNAKIQREEHGEGRSSVWLDPKINLAIHKIVVEKRQALLKETPVAVAKVSRTSKFLLLLSVPLCSLWMQMLYTLPKGRRGREIGGSTELL